MRQFGCVPIAPLPPSTVPATPVAPSSFTCDGLRENDVLMRKGGRPTHGKVQYFRFLQNRAEEYASYKSPIDRRLLARELVESWLCRGGRFCIAADEEGSASTSGSNANRNTNMFRVASTEEALQFTRRVLVRHFTPSINKRKSADRAPHNHHQQLPSKLPLSKIETSTSPPLRPVVMEDLELATSEAADALCCLRSTTTAATTTMLSKSLKPLHRTPPCPSTFFPSLLTHKPPTRVTPINSP